MDPFVGAEHYDGPEFELFGDDHLLALTLVVLWQVLLLKRFSKADPATKRRLRRTLAGGLWTQEMSYHLWRAATGTWTRTEMLPLHLCSANVWAGGLMLLTRSYRLYEFCYFGALVGAAVALLTPDIGRFSAPHYRFVQFFVSHGLILAAPLWMTFGEGFRPRWSSVAKASGGMLAYGALVYAANRRLGSNYLFLSRKPATASVLDALPPWPGYVPWMAGLVVASFALLYAPWALKDVRDGQG